MQSHIQTLNVLDLLILHIVLDNAFCLFSLRSCFTYLDESELILEVFFLLVLSEVEALREEGVNVHSVPPDQVLQTVRQSCLRCDQVILQEMVHYLEVLQILSASLSLLDGKFKIKDWRVPVAVLEPAPLQQGFLQCAISSHHYKDLLIWS